MSNLTLGQGIGIVVGAVIGAYTGGAGWYLAGSILLGATAGYAVGSAIDPVAPDVPSAGQSATGELDVTLADEGIVIPDILGTVKATGNIFWYGGSRIVEVKEKVSGGKGGGSKKVVTGYKYYLSWAMGISIGPVDEVISIFQNENPIWQGNELRSNTTNGMTTITIDDLGTLYFYFGTSDQLENSYMGDLILSELGSSYNPPYNNLCWVYFKDCNLGSYNRVPTFKFVLRKSPTFSFNENNRIGGYDYNPIHAIYHLLTNGAEIPTTMIDEDSFSDSADALTLEGRGISLYFGEERSAITYAESIITHINAILQYENDGLFHMTLIRDNVDEGDMESFSEEDFIEPPIIKRSTWDETNNDIKVQYAKRVDVPFGDPVDPIKNPDVYVMGFIDEAITNACQSDWSDYASNGLSRGYSEGLWVDAYDQLTYGPACPKWDYDLNLYFDESNIARTKTWLLEGAYHISSLTRLQNYSGNYLPIAPNGTVPSLYCDYFDSTGNVSLWANQVALWQARFQIMINLGRGEFIPGSVLRVYIDTSSFGGIANLEPAYSQFKAWVLANYGGLVYLEYEFIGEFWLEALHEDLTPWGYGRG